MSKTTKAQQDAWPELCYEDLRDTLATVHLWTQIIGKIRLRRMPWINHSWHVALYISTRGLTTRAIPHSNGLFEIEMDFIAHQLIVSASDGQVERTGLYPRSVADFYKELFAMLHRMGIAVSIYARPNEIATPIPFEKDEIHASYDPERMQHLWRALARIEVVFTRFRAEFTGKVSPVHLFWGSFDLAVSRFSGRKAPKHPGGVPNIPDEVMQEAYSHEVSSAGFWPGGDDFPTPVFYSYCYPTPPDFKSQPVEPAQAWFSPERGEFFLPYETVRTSAQPEKTLLQFLRSTYRAAAVTGHWDALLECDLTAFER
jgi:hypothetical protein